MGSAVPSNQLHAEHFRALRALQDGASYASFSVLVIERLLEARLAWVGPPPTHEVQVSYRGRQALRELDGVGKTFRTPDPGPAARSAQRSPAA